MFPSFYGQTNPPSNIAGNSTKYYLFDTLRNKSYSNNIYTNYDATFSFDFSTSCTTKTKQYAEFIIGGPSTSEYEMLTFEVTGKSTSTNTTEYVNIELISTGSADDIDLGRVEVKKSETTTVRTDDVEQDALYYVLVTPDTQSAGHAIHANVTISN